MNHPIEKPFDRMSQAERLYLSEERVEKARKRFEQSRYNLTAAITYGTPDVIPTAMTAVRVAADEYAHCLQEHARTIIDTATAVARLDINAARKG